MNNVDAFRYLAHHSEHALLATVVAQAAKKDYQALDDFIGTMNQIGHEVASFWSGSESHSRYRLPESGSGEEVDVKRASFPRALMAAIAPSTHDERGILRERLDLFSERASDADMNLLSRCAGMGKFGDPRAFPNEKCRTYFLSSMLFHAASSTSDERVFQALIDAGANTTKKLVSNHKSFADKTVSPFREALLFGNHQGADAILNRMTPQHAVDAIVAMTEGPLPAGKTYAESFHELTEVIFLTHALSQGQADKVGQLLDTMCEQAQALGTGGDREQRSGGVFRCKLAGSYLRSTNTRSENDWTEDAISALRGTPEQLQAGSTIEGHAILWHAFKEKNPGEMWALHDCKLSIDKTPYHYAMADLAHQAVRANCVPILKDLQAYLAPTGTKGQAPDIGTAVSRSQRDALPIVASRLKASIDILVEKGHSVNEKGANYAGGGTPLHAAAMLPEPSLAVALPLLLTLSPNRNALDEEGNTPRQLVKKDEAQKTWDDITRSFDARNLAHGILSELEDLDVGIPTKTKLPKP